MSPISIYIINTIWVYDLHMCQYYNMQWNNMLTSLKEQNGLPLPWTLHGFTIIMSDGIIMSNSIATVCRCNAGKRTRAFMCLPCESMGLELSKCQSIWAFIICWIWWGIITPNLWFSLLMINGKQCHTHQNTYISLWYTLLTVLTSILWCLYMLPKFHIGWDRF